MGHDEVISHSDAWLPRAGDNPEATEKRSMEDIELSKGLCEAH